MLGSAETARGFAVTAPSSLASSSDPRRSYATYDYMGSSVWAGARRVHCLKAALIAPLAIILDLGVRGVACSSWSMPWSTAPSATKATATVAATAGLGATISAAREFGNMDSVHFKETFNALTLFTLHTSYDFASMKHPLKAEEAKTAVWREHIRIRTLC